MSRRKKRAEIARETIQVLERGYYETDSGKRVNIKEDLSFAVENTVLYRPEEFGSIDFESEPADTPEITVDNETTLEASESFYRRYGDAPFALNFASARQPGGGFLNGSGAQEESLARASGLYACISPVSEYYRANEREGSALYTDHMIYSPRVPVFRGADGDFLEQPYYVSVLTAPAVNRNEVARGEPEKLPAVERTMDERTNKVLRVAADQGHDRLVLGAWGCGVFGNSPKKIAEIFRRNLVEAESWSFERVHFAVLDRSKSRTTYRTFRHVLVGSPR